MENTVYSRILKVRNYNGLNQKEFADKTGVSESSIKKYEKGSSMPGGEFFIGLVQNFPDINIRWLLTGQGEMFLQSSEKPSPGLEERVFALEKELKELKGNYKILFEKVKHI